MKKIIMLLIGCCILTACMTPEQRAEKERQIAEQKRAIFEEKFSKPDIDCTPTEDIGEMPTDVEAYMDKVPLSDHSMCRLSNASPEYRGIIPIQQINSREFLAYPCLWETYPYCPERKVLHFKFPYSVGQLKANTLYELPLTICIPRQFEDYSYTTISGLKNTTYSVKLGYPRDYSKAERRKMATEKLKEAQNQWKEKYQQQQKKKEKCENISAKILEAWENSNDAETYCREVSRLEDGWPSPSWKYYRDDSGC